MPQVNNEFVNITTAYNVQRTLKNGSVINIRIVDYGKAPGSYIANFEGGMFELVTDETFEKGQIIKAAVNIENGQFFLSPLKNQQLENIQSTKINKFNFEKIENPLLRNFFGRIGIELNETTLKLVQFLMQNNQKIDPKLIRHSLYSGEKFRKKKEAAEISSCLSKKHINDTEGSISDILNAIQGGNENKNERRHSKDKDDGNSKKNDDDKGNWLSMLFSDGESLTCRDVGTLTFFNSIRIKDSPLHVVLLPFEFEGENGNARIFINTEKKTTEKIYIQYREFYFKLSVNEKKIVFFMDNPEKSDAKFNIKHIINVMDEFFDGYEKEFSEKAIPYGVVTSDTEINFLEGQE